MKVCIAFIMLFLNSFAIAQYGGGSGTELDPYLVADPNHLQAIGANPQDWNNHFRQTADIDLSGFDGQNGNPGLNRIGLWIFNDPNLQFPFTGVYDGGGHEIRNFTHPEDNHINPTGIFEALDGPNTEIRNLTLVNPQIINYYTMVGALVGEMLNGSILNCHVKGGDITASRHVGGLVGGHLGGNIENCSANALKIRTIGIGVGALVGYAAECMITKSYANCNVFSGEGCAGGLIGEVGYGVTISNCYALGYVEGERFTFGSGGMIGSVIGFDNTIVNSFSAAVVVSPQLGGGLVGSFVPAGINASFWDIDVSGQTFNNGGTGLATGQMQLQSTFMATGWDFVGETANGDEDIWRMCADGVGYPRLAWEFAQHGDFVCPDDTGPADLAYLGTHWLSDHPRTDIGPLTGDETTDYFDFSRFQDFWLNTYDYYPPSVPQNLAIGFISSGVVNLTWDAASDNVGVVSYTIYRDGQAVGSRGGPPFTGTFPENDTLYLYQISALDADGNESQLSEPVEVIYISP